MLGGAEEGERRGTEEGEGSGTPVLGGEEEREGGGTKEGEGAGTQALGGADEGKGGEAKEREGDGKLALGGAKEMEGVPAASNPFPTIYPGFGMLRTARTPRGTWMLRVPESLWTAEQKFRNATLATVCCQLLPTLH